MNSLVDTSVWSLALRRKPGDLSTGERSAVGELAELVTEGRARIIGPVRQELLSGIRNPAQYENLRQTLRSFPDEPIDASDYEAAGRAANDCRAKGIGFSAVDILICAVSLARRWAIFSTDPDFKNYSIALPITLHSPRR